MKQKQTLQQCIQSAAVALALASSTGVGLAVPDLDLGTFDADLGNWNGPTMWGKGWGSSTVAWDATEDNTANGGGSVYISGPFDRATSDTPIMCYGLNGGNPWAHTTPAFDMSVYKSLEFDIKWNNDATNMSLATFNSPPSPGGIQGLEIHACPDGAGGPILAVTNIPAAAASGWAHVIIPINPALSGLGAVYGIWISKWLQPDVPFSGTFGIWLDNVVLKGADAPPPPPTMDLAKAGVAGVEITMDDNTSQWQRNAISTPSASGPYLWASQGSYPVSYSLTIADFPAIAPHLGFEAHLYVANGDTSTANDQTSGSPDWGVPDIFIFRVENHAAEAYSTNGATITTNFTYDARAQIQWKTNHPSSNATNIPVIVDAPSALGTWTVTFTDPTNGTLSGPGITATNFTLPEDVVLSNFSPASSFMQFGMFKNDGANDGHNNQTHGTFSHVAFTGAAAPINDSFAGATLTNLYAWRKTSASAVQHLPPGTAWVVDWTLPASGFIPQSASAITGVWSNAVFSSTYTSGSKVYGLVPGAGLGNAEYYRLIKRPFTKLQVLMPGETAAPFTVSGKTGTPDAQAAGVPFNITVNAVDEVWNRVTSTDMITITSDDGSATLPADAALSLGTATFSVTFGTAGTWIVTATDVTDGTKSPNTGTPTVTN